MILAVTPLAAAAVLLVTAGLIRSTLDPARARGRATQGATLTAALTVLVAVVSGFLTGRGHGVLLDSGTEGAWTLTLLPAGLLSITNAAIGIAGVLACALAPLASHPPRTLRRMLLVLAVAHVFVATSEPWILAALWTVSAALAWRELRATADRRATARVFGIHHAVSSACLLLGAILVATGHAGWAIPLLLGAIAIREAIVPVHGWFPTFVERAPLGMVVAFAAPQLGVYAHLELFTEGLPAATAHGVAVFGAVTAVLAGALGTVQIDARRALAWLMMSQSGLVAFGLENSEPAGQIGALVTWQVLAVATSGFAMTLAALEARRGTLSLHGPGGSFARTPRMAVAFLILGFASVGLPGTLGFIAEDLLVQGSVEEYPLQAFALIIATALNGITVMRCFFALFSGSRNHVGEPDLVGRERVALTLAIAALVFTGLWPQALLALHETGAAVLSTGSH